VNFENIKGMILSKKDDDTVIVHTKNKIKPKKIDGGVHLICEPEDKTYSVVFKRRRLNDNTSQSFGYINATLTSK
jgi:RecB family endonuclease NucS